MTPNLKPQYHIFISEQLALDKPTSQIASSLVTMFNLDPTEASRLVQHVQGMRHFALSLTPENKVKPADTETTVTNNVSKTTISTINPTVKLDNNNVIKVDGRDVRVVFKMSNPEVILFDNLFDDLECRHLIDKSQTRLGRSTVANQSSSESVISEVRTSQSAYFTHGEDPIIKSMEDRISILFNWNNSDTDTFQVLKYEEDEQYVPHYDFFGEVNSFTKGVGERIATLILYLDSPSKGGGTTFPDLNLTVNCKRGSALYFAYPNPVPESKTLHSGDPVIEGTKWIATKWFRSLNKL